MKITKVKLKRRDADILAENLVEYNQAQIKTPIPAGETVAVMEDGVFEQFTRHPRGKIVPAGAFTHVVDASDDFFHLTLGRYCSVARGIRVVNGHHPLHSVTSNPITMPNITATTCPRSCATPARSRPSGAAMAAARSATMSGSGPIASSAAG